MSRILLAEDEAGVAAFLEKGLRAAGFTTCVVAEGHVALTEASSGGHDLLVLDLGLPVMDGFTVLRRLRQARISLPVVVLTARSAVEDRVAALEGGADDYLAKPFAFEELLARVRLRLRATGAVEDTILTVGGLRLDLRTWRAHIAGQAVQLSGREFALAEVFCRHPEQVLSRQQLLSRVWGLTHDPGSNLVDVYVRYLRRKLGGERIETVRGIGYRLLAKP